MHLTAGTVVVTSNKWTAAEQTQLDCNFDWMSIKSHVLALLPFFYCLFIGHSLFFFHWKYRKFSRPHSIVELVAEIIPIKSSITVFSGGDWFVIWTEIVKWRTVWNHEQDGLRQTMDVVEIQSTMAMALIDPISKCICDDCFCRRSWSKMRKKLWEMSSLTLNRSHRNVCVTRFIREGGSTSQMDRC